MFRFRLGSIPVHVHLSHLLFSTLMAFTWLPQAKEPGAWPGVILASPEAAGHAWAMASYVAVWAGVVFLAVLVHELGHATVASAFGYRPAIELAFLGGRTFSNPNETVPWFKEVALTLAGPVCGLLLGLITFFSSRLFAPDTAAHFFLSTLGVVSLFWSFLNLLPVTPLDGGLISLAVLQRFWGRRGFLLAQLLSLAVALSVVVLSFRAWGEDALMLLFLFGSWGVRSLMLVYGYLKGEQPPPSPNHPLEMAFQQAVGSFRQGNYALAQDLAEKMLKWDMQPALRSRYQHLQGWIALKQGEGRAALDHFSQVSSGVTVEAQGLAAAFSLVGDDLRALPLWERAWKETHDRTVLHEYAAALIRAGRLEEAQALPEVDFPTACACAARLLFLRKEYSAAASLEEEGLNLRPSPTTAYDAACAWARAGRADDAMRLLETARNLGFSDAKYAASDEDLASLHRDARFFAWLKGFESARS